MNDDREWFAPKRFGYGAGLPISWQGWAVIGAYAAIVFVAAARLKGRPVELAAILIAVTGVLIAIAVNTTRGGWRWRWGSKGRD